MFDTGLFGIQDVDQDSITLLFTTNHGCLDGGSGNFCLWRDHGLSGWSDVRHEECQSLLQVARVAGR